MFTYSDSKLGGGVAIYVKKDFEYDNVESHASMEILKLRTKGITFVVFYRPLNQNVDNFINELFDQISNREKVVLIGDSNIDLLKNDKYSELFINLINGCALECPTSSLITRKTHMSSSSIDQIITDLNIDFCQIVENNFSKHSAV